MEIDIVGNVFSGPTADDLPAPQDPILQAAAELLHTGGIDALSTRSVATAAGVQPPAIYRQFGGKKRLLDALTLFVFDRYISENRRLIAASTDPLRKLEQMWELHVDFGLTNPHCYLRAYIHAEHTRLSSCAAQSFELLRHVVTALGSQGRLRLSVERAADLIRSAARGVVLALIALPPHERDLQLSDTMRDNTLSAIVNDEPALPSTPSDLPGRALALHEKLRSTEDCKLTHAERKLLGEWLVRLADEA
ncbi:TetR/AcrR family transcriptional regulator [Mycobacterium kubicae]|nr:TetR/AcrR family transcriptional regulator [Mycobacterium kubicae]